MMIGGTTGVHCHEKSKTEPVAAFGFFLKNDKELWGV